MAYKWNEYEAVVVGKTEVKGKSVPLQSRWGPEGYSWYSFLLEAESTPGP